MSRTRALVVLAALTVACARATAPAAGPGVTEPATHPDLVFVLEDTYPVGTEIEVRIHNRGTDTYRYNSTGYQACDLTYTDARGREFLIPPGTHCDLVMIVDLAPGQTASLFHWKLDECVKDDWGCTKAEPLPPGEYTIAGDFERAGGGTGHAEATFRISE